MSNVHGFQNNTHGPESGNQIRINRTPRNAPSPRRQQNNIYRQQNAFVNWNYTMENLRAVEEHRVLFLSGNTKIKNPKDQNYFDMLKITCCPVTKLCSITTFLLVAVIGVYTAELIMGINMKGQLLQIEVQVLLKLGANFSPKVKSGEVWRLIAAQFLHINFLHLFGNLITLLIFVSRVEYTFGWWKTLIIYIISGIGGNIFSCLTNPSNSVIKAGASTCLFGIIGVILGYVFLNWKGFDVIGILLKWQLIFISFMIILFIFVLTPYAENIDYLGHLGGFLTGVTLCAIHKTIRNERRQKITRGVMLSLSAGFLGICFLVFYLR